MRDLLSVWGRPTERGRTAVDGVTGPVDDPQGQPRRGRDGLAPHSIGARRGPGSQVGVEAVEQDVERQACTETAEREQRDQRHAADRERDPHTQRAVGPPAAE